MLHQTSIIYISKICLCPRNNSNRPIEWLECFEWQIEEMMLQFNNLEKNNYLGYKAFYEVFLCRWIDSLKEESSVNRLILSPQRGIVCINNFKHSCWVCILVLNTQEIILNKPFLNWIYPALNSSQKKKKGVTHFSSAFLSRNYINFPLC